MINLGLIGLGEAGFHLTADMDFTQIRLRAFDQATSFAGGRAAIVRSNAQQNHITLVDSMDALIERSDILFCLTSANSALPIAREAAAKLRAGQIYCDLNSTSPQIKEAIAACFAGAGADFVEGAIMASVPVNRTKVPIFVCGEKAPQLAAALNAAGMQLTFLSVRYGAASAAKMLKSVLFKGFIALLTETVFATDRYGITEMTLESLRHMMLEEMTYEACCNYFVETMAVHAERLCHEMEEVVSTLDAMGENSIMARATMEKMRWMAEQGYPQHFVERPDGYAGVLSYKRELEARKPSDIRDGADSRA